MATTEMHAYHDRKYILEKNNYLSDGHGAEPLGRTNRYLQDTNYLMPETHGYNVPEDPRIAALMMELAQKEYEYNLGRADVINRGNGARSVYLFQFFISFHNLEWVSPQQRHEMIAQLINDLIRRGCLVRVVDHNNTWCRHIHIIVCAYEPDGHHKVRITLADLRRIMDRICADYGLSIIDTAYLRRDEEYAKWFYLIVEMGEIVIHPPKSRETHHETREESPHKQWKKPEHPAWAPQTAGRYHYLPPWISPWDATRKNMYCPAMDMDDPLWRWGLPVRHAPMYLLLVAAVERTQAYEEALRSRQNKKDRKRIARVQMLSRVTAGGLELIQRIDVGTIADIDRHITCAKRDIKLRKNYKKELAQEKREASTCAPQKVDMIVKRRTLNDQRIEELKQECRQLEKLRELCRMLRDPHVWEDYSDIIVPYTPKEPQPEKRIPRKPYIRAELRSIGQLIGADSVAAEEEMWSVVQRGQPAVIKRCATVIPDVTIGIAQAMADVATLCTTITDPYAEHDRIDAVREQLQRQMDGGTLLRGMLALDTALLRYESGPERDRIAARVRSAAEGIQWHLDTALHQLTTAQSVSTLRTAYGVLALAMEEWCRFVEAEMPRLSKHVKVSPEEVILPPPCPDYTQKLKEQVTFDFTTALDQYRARMKRARDTLDRSIVRRYGPDPVGDRIPIPPVVKPDFPETEPDPTAAESNPPKEELNSPEEEPDVSEKEQKAEPSRPPLVGMIANARDRSGQPNSTHQGKQGAKDIEH